MELDLNAVAVKAVYDLMTTEQREELIKKSLEKMFSEKEGAYGKQKTLLESAVEQAARRSVERYADEYFDEHEEEMKKLVGEIIARCMEGEARTALVEQFAQTVTKGMRGW